MRCTYNNIRRDQSRQCCRHNGSPYHTRGLSKCRKNSGISIDCSQQLVVRRRRREKKRRKRDVQRPLTFYGRRWGGWVKRKEERQGALFVTLAPAAAINSSIRVRSGQERQWVSLSVLFDAILTSVFECSDDQSETISSFTVSVCHVLQSQVIWMSEHCA